MAATVLLAADPVAARLARDAEAARKAGRYVRAYLLYSEAAARDKSNSTYIANRDALAPFANLLSKADVETANVADDVKAAEHDAKATEPPVEIVPTAAWRDPRPACYSHAAAESGTSLFRYAR